MTKSGSQFDALTSDIKRLEADLEKARAEYRAASKSASLIDIGSIFAESATGATDNGLVYEVKGEVAFTAPEDVETLRYYTTRQTDRVTFPEFVADEDGGYARIVLEAADTFWDDMNHISPGVGLANLLAVVYFDSLGGPVTDVKDARLTYEIRLKDFHLPKGARLFQWLQGIDPVQGNGENVFLNYLNVAEPIDQQLGFGSTPIRPPAVDGVADTGWRTVEVNFTARRGAWVCMGSNSDRTGIPSASSEYPALYGCAKNAASFLQSGEKVDTGILVVYPGRQSVTARPTGEIHIRRVRFEIPVSPQAAETER